MTYQLHLQLDDSLKGDLQAFADAHRLTLAAAVRLAIIQMLKENGEDVTR